MFAERQSLETVYSLLAPMAGLPGYNSSKFLIQNDSLNSRFLFAEPLDS